jgi:DNA-binding PadR family transcriptional regulator
MRHHHNPDPRLNSRHHGGPGFGGFGPEMFGFGGGPWFGPHRGNPGGRARKGDVRSVILILLADGPSNGYGLIKAINTKTAGMWRPSPGSVNPPPPQLVDEGLISPTGTGPRTEFELTDEGKAYVEETRATLASAWTASEESLHQHGELLASAGKLAGVIRQVHEAGTPEQRSQAATKLDDLRRELYRMLGE